MKLSLYYPVKPLFVNQKFGETANLQYYKDHGLPFIGHNGMDFASKHGQPVYAAHDGTAYVEILDEKSGNGVVIRTNEPFEWAGGTDYMKSIYWHLLPNIPITDKQQVKAGDLIGYADSTGISTGDHLHFGLKPQAKTGEPDYFWANVAQENGYMGAVDPSLYFNGIFAQDINGPARFDADLKYLDVGDEVVRLQHALNGLGYFKTEYAPRYGPATTAAVYAFQLDHVNLSYFEKTFLKGKTFGPKTRLALNNLLYIKSIAS